MEIRQAAIQYMNSLTRWELLPWVWLVVRFGVLNFFLIAIGFFAGAATPTNGVAWWVLTKVYSIDLALWVLSMVGMTYALYSGRGNYHRGILPLLYQVWKPQIRD